MRLPVKLTDQGQYGQSFNQVIDALRALVPARGPGIRTAQRVHGVERLPTIPQPRGIAIQVLQCFEHHDNYITCRTWDGTNAGTQDILVAKPPALRFSVLSRVTASGVTISYSGWDTVAQSRNATDGTIVEVQAITPNYPTSGVNFANLIFAIQVPYTGVSVNSKALTIQDLNIDGRAWAAIDEIEPT